MDGVRKLAIALVLLASSCAAHPPPHAPSVSGIKLGPAPHWLKPYCLKAARSLGYAVLCPTRLPRRLKAILPCRSRAPRNELWGRDCYQYVLDGLFVGPPAYRGLFGRPLGHFALWTTQEGGDFDTGGLFACPGGGVHRGRAAPGGVTGTWWLCPAGRSANLNSGHLAFQWRRRGLIYGVSVHGNTVTNRRLVTSLLHGTRLVGPARRRGTS